MAKTMLKFHCNNNKPCVVINIVIIEEFFGLVSLFKSISTFVGYLMPKPFL